MPSVTLTTPSVTTRWPGRRPCDDLDPAAERERRCGPRCGARGPARRRRRRSGCSPSPTTASSGTDRPMRGALSIATVSSMPGRSRRSGLGSSARTITARVLGSITGSMVGSAAERLVGIGGRARPRSAGRARIAAQHRLGHGEIELDRADVADRRDLGALARRSRRPRCCASDTQPEKGARITRSPICGAAPAAPGRAPRRRRRPARRRLERVAKPRSLSSSTRRSCCCASRARACASRSWALCCACCEHGDHLAALDEAAVVEIEPDDPLGDRRRERHLLVGARGADRLDPVGEAHRASPARP